MTGVFLVCATVGGTVLAIQLVLTLIGLGSHGLDMDVSHDVGGDFHGDVGGDFHGDAGDLHGGDADLHGDSGHLHHDSTSAFQVISFRTVTAALTFFGLFGLASQSTGASQPTVLLVALAAGAAALYGVYWLMRAVYRFNAEGTAKIQHAVGKHASVYLRIPGHEAGAGKIQVNLQNRTMEYLAMTAGEPIPTGAKVVVVDVLTPDTVAVEPLLETERVENV
jgi:hypothetical protein